MNLGRGPGTDTELGVCLTSRGCPRHRGWAQREKSVRWGRGLSLEAFWPPGAALVAVAGRGSDERVRVDPGRDPGIYIERRGLLAFGDRPRHRGRARCEKLVSSDPGRVQGPFLGFEASWPSGVGLVAAAGRAAKN